MKVLGIIPSRYASTRFPGKPLCVIKGKTMIQRVYDSCMSCEELDEVIVATDDFRIENHLKSINANYRTTSPNHENGTERIAEVAKRVKGYDLIINIQGDEPCINPKQIETLISFMKSNPNFKVGTLAKELNEQDLKNNNIVKVLYRMNEADDFCRIVNNHQELVEFKIGRHVGIYAFHTQTLLDIVNMPISKREKDLSLEQLRWMDNDIKIGVEWTIYESPAVDIPEDVAKVELFLEKNNKE